jgi:hypothetical protein
MSRSTTPRAPPSFAALVQSFFTEHLTQQRAMSPRMVATYRDGFVLSWTSRRRTYASSLRR